MDVRLTFRGLCGFVPSSDVTAGVPLEWLGVFLVNADEDSQAKFQKKDLCIHRPFISFNLSDLDELNNAPDELAFWSLKEEDLVVVTGNNQVGVDVNWGKPSDPKKPTTSAEEELFNWVSSMEEVLPGAEEVHENCFREVPDEGRITARFHFSEGTLGTAKIGVYDSEPVIMQFDPSGPGSTVIPRAVTTAVSLDIYGVNGPFIMRAQKFGSSSFRGLRFRDKGANSTLNIGIFNVCDGNFGYGQVGGRQYPGMDEDFGWYYILSRLIVVKDDELPIPVAVEFVPKGGQGGREPARCADLLLGEPLYSQVRTMKDLADKIRTA